MGIPVKNLIRAAIPLFVYFMGVALAEDATHGGDLDTQWRDIQAHADRHDRAQWWQGLTALELRDFVREGVELNLKDHRGWTALHSAARYNTDPEVVQLLLDEGMEVNAKDRAGDTALHWAAAENPNAEVVKALLEAGANINQRDRYGWLPIHSAADRSSNPEVIEVLMNAGSNSRSRAYFILFRPTFLLKHNANLSDSEKEKLLTLLDTTE